MLTRARPAARRGRARRRSTPSSPPATRSPSPGWAGASSGPRSARCCAPATVGARVKLTVVGCSGSAPGPKSPASCYLVEHDGFRLLLDLGNGAFGALQGAGRPGRGRRGLPLPPARRPLPRRRAVRRLAPVLRAVARRRRCRCTRRSGAERRLALAYDADGDGLTDVFDFVPVGPGLVHPRPVRGRRWPAPRTRSSATPSGSPPAGGRWSTPATPGPCERVVELARGADVLLAEAAHPPRPGPAGRAAPHRPGGRRARRGGRAWAGCCSPTSPRGSTRSASCSPPARSSPRPSSSSSGARHLRRSADGEAGRWPRRGAGRRPADQPRRSRWATGST